MNEFLKNLRTPQRNPKPRHRPATRKEVEGNVITTTDRRRGKERRASQPFRFEEPPQGNGMVSKGLPNIQDHLEVISSAVEKIAETNEKLAESQMEFHRSFVTLFDHLAEILSKDALTTDNATESGQDHEDLSAPMGEIRYTKKEVIDIIREMRKKRCTFGEIAGVLKSRNIPTFSGRGEWHAQTIHRLCRKN